MMRAALVSHLPGARAGWASPGDRVLAVIGFVGGPDRWCWDAVAG